MLLVMLETEKYSGAVTAILLAVKMREKERASEKRRKLILYINPKMIAKRGCSPKFLIRL